MQKRQNRNYYNSEKFRMAKQREYFKIERDSVTDKATKMFKRKPFANDMRSDADAK